MKDSDILGEPITGVRYNDRTYTFYPYAGRMASPKGGLLGFIKTAKGRLHGRFYTHGQWFMFEPAPEGREPFLAHYTVGKDVTAEAIVDKLIESDAADTGADVDPKAYMMSLRRKRDVVQALIKRFAVSHRWGFGFGDRVAVTFPKELNFKQLLADYGVAPTNVMGISGGSKNYRLEFYWEPGDLDTLVNDWAGKLGESDDATEVDPGAYVTTLRRKRDIVLSLLDQYALHREWTGTDRLIVTHPKKVRFEDVLRANGAPPHASVRSTSGKNYRTLFLWEPGDLDRVVKD